MNAKMALLKCFQESIGAFYVPTAPEPQADMVTSRFIGKVGLEAFANTLCRIPGWHEEVVNTLRA
jgi:hypothetical protein